MVNMDSSAPEATRRGIDVNKTSVSSQPLKNAMTNPPMNVVTSCRNFPTCAY